jgi:hypothetical protein
MLSQRPPVLPLQARHQPRHILPDPGPRLNTREPGRDPLMYPLQLTGDKIHHRAGDKIHHRALNDPPTDQLSAVAVLRVNRATWFPLRGGMTLRL